MNPMRRVALSYRRRGWSVIPLQTRSMQPLVAWRVFERRIASKEEIASWFEDWPDADIGLVTGNVSNLVVLDVDVGCAAPESLERLEGEHGPLPDTVAAETGGGGRHYYFATSASELRSCTNLYPRIHLRADGGIVMAPPSTHPNGRHYRWVGGHAPSAMHLAALPAWLERADLCTQSRRHATGAPVRRSYMKPSFHH